MYKTSLPTHCLQFILLLSVFFSTAQASAPTAFNQGANFFEQGHYAQAASAFEKARQQGMQSAGLFFNLASSYYKLKRYDLAKKYYLRVREYPKMRSLAEYNLALTAFKQHQDKQAKRWLTAVIQQQQHPDLVALAKKKLAKHDTTADIKRYSLYGSISLGNDSNINIAELSATSLSDSYTQLQLSGNYLLSSQKSSGWFADAAYYQRQHATETLFDSTELTLGISKRQRLNKWAFKYALQQSSSTYASADYQTILRLNLYAYYKLSRQQKLNFSFRYNDISSETTSLALAGSRQNIKLEYRRYHKHSNQRYSYELETNNRNDSVNSSFSPTRHRLRYQYFWYLDNNWRLLGDISWRQSDYPATPTEQRNDTRWRAAATAEYRFSHNMKLKLRYSSIDNQSNLPQDSYKKQLLSLSLSKLF